MISGGKLIQLNENICILFAFTHFLCVVPSRFVFVVSFACVSCLLYLCVSCLALVAHKRISTTNKFQRSKTNTPLPLVYPVFALALFCCFPFVVLCFCLCVFRLFVYFVVHSVCSCWFPFCHFLFFPFPCRCISHVFCMFYVFSPLFMLFGLFAFLFLSFRLRKKKN